MRTPCAAAVALATCGFCVDAHDPNGGMFVAGTWSSTVPAGAWSASTSCETATANDDVALPIVHASVAP